MHDVCSAALSPPEANRDQAYAKRRAKQWLWLLGVPALLLLLSLWLLWNSASSAAVMADAQLAQYQATLQEYQTTLRKLDAIEAREGWSTSVRNAAGQSIPISLAKSRVQAAMRELQDPRASFRHIVETWQKPLAVAAAALSALALLWAGLGLVYQRRIGTQAMQSREQLLAAFLRGQKLLPVYMASMIVLLASAASALLACVSLFLLRHPRYDSGGKPMFVAIALAVVLLVLGICVLIDVIRSARLPLHSAPLQIMGQIVTRAQAPRLWSFVGAVAQRVGASMPDAIVAGLDKGFFVTECPVQLHNGAQVPAGRVLYLPLPYMAFLNASEVAAVIGHELGHFIGQDTVYSQRFAPIYTAAIGHLQAVAGARRARRRGGDDLLVVMRPALIFGEMFLDSFHEAVRFWSRKRELAADAVGAQVAGAQAVARSLLRIAALEPRVQEALATHWDTGQSIAGGVLNQVRQLVAAKGMANPGEHLQNRQSHPFDTHPELAVRLEALGMPVSDELLQRAMNPATSPLLHELDLEAVAALAPSDQTAGAADINTALQTELAEAAAANRQAKLRELSAMVQLVQADQPVFERMWILALAFAVLGLFALSLSAIMTASARAERPGLFVGMLAVGIAALAWGGWLLWRSSRRPALVFRPHGLQLFGQRGVLSWGAIKGLEFANPALFLYLREPMPAPMRVPGVSRLRCRYSKARQRVRIGLILSSKQAGRVGGLSVDYWHAYYAKMELQRMGASVEPAKDADCLALQKQDLPVRAK